MASFTDAIVQFNPYIKEIPDSFNQVGLIKQAQYDKNVQAIHSGIDRIYNLPIMQDAAKGYVKGKADSMVSSLNKYLSDADFSNQAIVNQVGQYANELLSDPLIKKHLQTSSKIQSDLTLMAKAKESGKEYGVENEVLLNKEVNKYQNGDVNANYKGEYVPFIDVRAKVIDSWSKMNPNSTLISQPQLDGSTKFIVMEGTEKVKELSETEVYNSLSGLLTGSEMKQLNITGMYRTSGISGESFVNSFYEREGKKLDNQITYLNSQLTLTSADREADRKKIQTELEKLKERKKAISSDKESRLKEMKDENPEIAAEKEEQVKAQLWTEGWKEGMSDFIAYRETESSLKVDKAYMDILYPDLNKSNKKSGDGNNETQQPLVPVVNQDDIKAKEYNTFVTDYNSFVAATNAKKNEVLYKLNPSLLNKSTLKNEDGTFSTVYTVKKDKEKEVDVLWKKAYTQWLNGDETLPLEFSTAIAEIDGSAKISASKYQIIKKIEEEYKQFISDKIPQYKITHSGGEHSFKVTYEKLKSFSEVLGQIPRLPKLGKSAVGGATTSGATAEIPVDPKALDNLLFNYGFTRAEFETYNDLYTKQGKGNTSFEQFKTIINAYKAEVPNEIVFKNDKINQYQQKLNISAEIINPDIVEKSGIVGSVVGEYAQALNKLGGITAKKITDAFAQEKSKRPTVGYTQNEEGTPFLRIYNIDAAHPVTQIPMSKVTATSMGWYKNDSFGVARALLAANEGGSTGSTELQAINVPIQGKTKARYQLNEVQPNQYKLTFYFAKNNKKRIFVDNQKPYTWAELEALLPMLNETAISAYLDGKSTSPFSAAGVGNMFPTQVLNSNPPSVNQPNN